MAKLMWVIEVNKVSWRALHYYIFGIALTFFGDANADLSLLKYTIHLVNRGLCNRFFIEANWHDSNLAISVTNRANFRLEARQTHLHNLSVKKSSWRVFHNGSCVRHLVFSQKAIIECWNTYYCAHNVAMW